MVFCMDNAVILPFEIGICIFFLRFYEITCYNQEFFIINFVKQPHPSLITPFLSWTWQLQDLAKHNWNGEWQVRAEPESHVADLAVNHSFSLFGGKLTALNMTVKAEQVRWAFCM